MTCDGIHDAHDNSNRQPYERDIIDASFQLVSLWMFHVYGNKLRHCDGVTRRRFLQAGAMGIGGFRGFTLADLFPFTKEDNDVAIRFHP